MQYIETSFHVSPVDYYIDGKTIPEVNFDVGPSWSGGLFFIGLGGGT